MVVNIVHEMCAMPRIRLARANAETPKKIYEKEENLLRPEIRTTIANVVKHR